MAESRPAPEDSCITPERHPNPVVRVRDIAYLIFDRPDPESAEAFFTDFGLHVVQREGGNIYMRASGPEHHCIMLRKNRRSGFGGVGFHVPDASDLDRLAALPDASAVEEIREPGGGRRVRLLNPDGLRVDAIHGRETVPEIQTRSRFEMNTIGPAPDHLRRANQTVRVETGPAQPYRLGHTVQSARNVDRTIRWYQEHLGLIVSDFQFAEGVPDVLTAFMRCDRGATPSDHHTLAIGFGPVVGHLHSAFECHDLDDLMAGDVYLKDRQRRHSWGVGRHVLGSQIFNYWRDPAGDMFEHYADGDRFDVTKKADYLTISARDSHHQWGPPMTRDFLGLTARDLLRDLPGILKRFLKRGDPLTPGKLMRMAKGMHSSQNFHKMAKV